MPIEFIQQSQPAGSSSDTLFRLLMKYDGTGRRISKTVMHKVAGAADWDTAQVTIGTEIRENFVGPAKETKVVVNMPEGLGRYEPEDAAVLPSSSTSRTFEWYLKNHLGSTMLVYASGYGTPGVVRAAYDYRAFGEQVTLTESADKVTENFTGKEKDDETGLSYHEARYLDPMLGVWISVDPKRFFPSPYFYMGNGYNPIRFADLNGKAPGDGFDNPDYAAMDAGAAYQLESSFLDKEMGGIIYMLDGAYYATPWTYTDEDVYNASQSEFVDIDAFAKRMVPAGAVEVAEYHGHGRYKRDPITGDFAWNYNFSWGENSDESSAKLSGRPLYLIPAKMNLPNGMGKPARVYNPITGEDRALKYVDSFNTRKEANAHKIINNSH